MKPFFGSGQQSRSQGEAFKEQLKTQPVKRGINLNKLIWAPVDPTDSYCISCTADVDAETREVTRFIMTVSPEDEPDKAVYMPENICELARVDFNELQGFQGAHLRQQAGQKIIEYAYKLGLLNHPIEEIVFEKIRKWPESKK